MPVTFQCPACQSQQAVNAATIISQIICSRCGYQPQNEQANPDSVAEPATSIVPPAVAEATVPSTPKSDIGMAASPKSEAQPPLVPRRRVPTPIQTTTQAAIQTPTRIPAVAEPRERSSKQASESPHTSGDLEITKLKNEAIAQAIPLLSEPSSSFPRVPQSSHDSETKPIGWWNWALGELPPSQKEWVSFADDLLSGLLDEIEYLDGLPSEGNQRLTDSIVSYQADEAKAVLDSTPIERLSALAPGARIEPLRSAGYAAVGSVVGWQGHQFQQLQGIGNVSASLLAEAVRQIEQKVASQPFQIPAPDDVTPKHEPILNAAYTVFSSDRVPDHSRPQALAFATELEALVKKFRSAKGLVNRLFRRSQTEKKLADLSNSIRDLCQTQTNQNAVVDFRSMLQRLEPPSHLPDLVAEYRQHFADFVAIIERCADRTAISSQTRSDRRGGLPSEIADAVEAVTLQVDNLDVNLRAYQEFGIKYLVHQRRTVLGDEMGLGKTIQALGAAVHVNTTESANRFLIVAPASILGNWEREISARTDLPIYLLHGALRDATFRKWQAFGGFGLTSFATLRSLQDMERAEIDYLIVDEAHYAKNPSAGRSKLVSSLAANSQRVTLMTGTPLENRALEFVNLIRICDGNLANRVNSAAGGGIISVGNADQFVSQVAPVYLRRNQQDVLNELPEMMETDEWVELTSDDWKKYDANVGSKSMMGLRQSANGWSTDSAKMKRLAELADFYRDQNQKIVVFSFFKNTLELATQVLGSRHRIDGSVPINQRMKIVDSFNDSSDWESFVLQIGAGGVGLNLQSAAAVILIEPQYKPTTEWQAIKRVHRMGQTQRVMVHRLLASDTVDERLRDMNGSKTDVFNEYARDSSVASASASATDPSEAKMTQTILAIEEAKYRQRQLELVSSVLPGRFAPRNQQI